MFFVILFSSLFSLADGHAQGKLNCCLFVFMAVLFLLCFAVWKFFVKYSRIYGWFSNIRSKCI